MIFFFLKKNLFTCIEKQWHYLRIVVETALIQSTGRVFLGDLGSSLHSPIQCTVYAVQSTSSWEANVLKLKSNINITIMCQHGWDRHKKKKENRKSFRISLVPGSFLVSFKDGGRFHRWLPPFWKRPRFHFSVTSCFYPNCKWLF